MSLPLPTEILLQIFSEGLNYLALKRVAATCHRFRAILEDETLLRRDGALADVLRKGPVRAPFTSFSENQQEADALELHPCFKHIHIQDPHSPSRTVQDVELRHLGGIDIRNFGFRCKDGSFVRISNTVASENATSPATEFLSFGPSRDRVNYNHGLSKPEGMVVDHKDTGRPVTVGEVLTKCVSVLIQAYNTDPVGFNRQPQPTMCLVFGGGALFDWLRVNTTFCDAGVYKSLAVEHEQKSDGTLSSKIVYRDVVVKDEGLVASVEHSFNIQTKWTPFASLGKLLWSRH